MDLQPLMVTPVQNDRLGNVLRRPPTDDPTVYDTSINNHVAVVLCGDLFDNEQLLYNGTILLFIADTLSWETVTDCYLCEANGFTLLPGQKYISIGYADYSANESAAADDGKPVYVTAVEVGSEFSTSGSGIGDDGGGPGCETSDTVTLNTCDSDGNPCTMTITYPFPVRVCVTCAAPPE
jgi:hypothetical protein